MDGSNQHLIGWQNVQCVLPAKEGDDKLSLAALFRANSNREMLLQQYYWWGGRETWWASASHLSHLFTLGPWVFLALEDHTIRHLSRCWEETCGNLGVQTQPGLKETTVSGHCVAESFSLFEAYLLGLYHLGTHPVQLQQQVISTMFYNVQPSWTQCISFCWWCLLSPFLHLCHILAWAPKVHNGIWWLCCGSKVQSIAILKSKHSFHQSEGSQHRFYYSNSSENQKTKTECSKRLVNVLIEEQVHWWWVPQQLLPKLLHSDLFDAQVSHIQRSPLMPSPDWAKTKNITGVDFSEITRDMCRGIAARMAGRSQPETQGAP